jgi:NADPH2:quinone reductase
MTIHAVRIRKTGGPEILRWEEVRVGQPDPGQVRIKQTACGVNMIDTYMRSGLYPVQDFPFTLGVEAAGTVTDVGKGVTDFLAGDRVAYCMVPGAYVEERLIDADKLVKVPDNIDDKTAAACMLKGLTAYYLLFKTYPVKKGETILVYAAAGATGSIVCQWAHHLGARVIGCASASKAEMAKANGCEAVISYDRENIVERVNELTDGNGVDVVYDSLGADTFEASLDTLRPLGMMVSFGNATGPVTGFNLAVLASKGSLYLARPSLATYLSIPGFLAEASDALFEAIATGVIHIDINQTYELMEATQAHEDLENKKTTGASILLT